MAPELGIGDDVLDGGKLVKFVLSVEIVSPLSMTIPVRAMSFNSPFDHE